MRVEHKMHKLNAAAAGAKLTPPAYGLGQVVESTGIMVSPSPRLRRTHR
jgi:hypothetical protein